MRAKDLGPQQRSCFCYSPPHGAAIIGIVFFIASTVMSLMLTGLILEWDEIMENFGNERTVDCERRESISSAIANKHLFFPSRSSDADSQSAHVSDPARVFSLDATRIEGGEFEISF
jgi:hypothetical protein